MIWLQTYNADFQVADGSSAATAIFSGVKTKRSTIGYDYQIDNNDPGSVANATELETILDWAQAAGKSTGFVTTGRVTDGSTAALYGHSYNPSMMECDSPQDMDDLAYQMIMAYPGKSTNVIMGGGYDAFVPAGTGMPNRPVRGIVYPWCLYDSLTSYLFQNLDDSAHWSCNRTDEQNLLSEWLYNHPENSSMVTDVTQLNNVSPAETDHILGLFARADMAFEDKRDTLIDPSLSLMVEKAIEV